MIKYSFIIPVKEINDYIRESVPKILAINRDDYEIIIYPDQTNSETWPKTRQIVSPPGPAIKRTLAIRDAQGEILVFIDDDAYPKENFLDVLDEDFSDPSIVAVSGPAVTPEDDTFLQKVSGAVFLSSLSYSHPERYVPVGEKRFVDDWPTVNLSVRKKIFEELGGFDTSYWPGEDTEFCLKLLIKKNKKILYNPALIVWHHRREGFIKHLQQIGGYGIHRGFFAKRYPKTSFRLKYFIPSAFLFYALAGVGVGVFFPSLLKYYGVGWVLYAFALASALRDVAKYEKDKRVLVRVPYYIFFTHIVYGYKFIVGFIFTRELKSKLR